MRTMWGKKLLTGPKPFINVTPLIDVLLVLLIIFMVVSPLKPSRFKTFVPEPPKPEQGAPPEPNILTLVVTIKEDGTLVLNEMEGVGTVNDTAKLSAMLADVFRQRLANHAYRPDMAGRLDLPEEQRVQRTVFVKAPQTIRYGEVAKVIDGIRGAGGEPIGLQIDRLD